MHVQEDTMIPNTGPGENAHTGFWLIEITKQLSTPAYTSTHLCLQRMPFITFHLLHFINMP